MKFFVEFLNRFGVSDILHMYSGGAFRTSEEISRADYAINYKVVFYDAQISSSDLRIYHHLQRVIDMIRAQALILLRSLRSCHEDDRHTSMCAQTLIFKYFCKFGENEREVKPLNLLERRLIFSFNSMDERCSPIFWLAKALEELLNYVMRDFEAADRVGLVIEYETFPNKTAAISIRLKNQLTSCVVKKALVSVIQSNKIVITEENMTLQVVRIRLPKDYLKPIPGSNSGSP